MSKPRISTKLLLLLPVTAFLVTSFTLGTGSAARTTDAVVPPHAAISPVCDAATLRGRFAFKGSGVVPSGPPPAPLVPFGVIGLLTMDGEGSLTNASTASNNGTIQSGLRLGAYTVNEDCTGTMRIMLPFPPFELSHNLVISEKGDSFYMIGTDPSVVTFEARRLR